MSRQGNPGPTNQAVEIEDLTVEEFAQDAVKGGVIDTAGKTYYVGSANGGVWK